MGNTTTQRAHTLKASAYLGSAIVDSPQSSQGHLLHPWKDGDLLAAFAAD
jgi:hypothetical protein